MFGKTNNVIKANTPVKHPEMYPDALNTVKENASDKMSDYLTEIIIGHVAAELGFQNHGVCLQVIPSLLSPFSLVCSHPTFPTAKTSKPSFFDFSSLQNTTETLAMLASCFQIISNPSLYQQHPALCSLQECKQN